MGYIKMSAFKKIARLYSNYRLVGHDAQGNNIQISFEDFWRQLDIEASGGGGQPVFFEGNQLPSENNTGDPLVKGDWTFLKPGTDYTNINGGDNIEAPEKRLSFGIFNGEEWELLDMGEMPMPEGVDYVRETGTELPMEKAVWRADQRIKEKVLQIVSEETKIVEVQDTEAGFAYGNSEGANIYGWSFPIKARNRIVSLSIDFYNSWESVSQQRLVISREDGTEIFNQLYNISMPIGGGRKTAKFEFPEPLEAYGQYLTVTVKTDQPAGIYRTNPAQVFTEEAGYPRVRFSIIADINDITMTGTSFWFDVTHSVEYETQEITDFTEWAKEKISEIANENIEIPEDIEKASELVNSVFSEEYISTGEMVRPFYEAIGPQGNQSRRMVIPLGELSPFDRIRVPFYFLADGSRTRPEQASITVLRGSTDGEEIASASSSFPATGGTGVYWVEFQFDNIIDEGDTKLYLYVEADGQFGFYRRYPGAASLFTAENGYEPYKYSNSMSGELTQSTTYFDFQHERNVFEKKIILSGVEIDGDSPSAEGSELPNENERIGFTGSSVTWGDGYLQSGYVAEYIKWKQSKVATAVLATMFSNGSILSNRKYFLGQAIRLDGAGTSIEFKLTGNEVSIIQSMRRTNESASEIEVYIDGDLYDTFNNFNNSDIGTNTDVFEGDGENTMFNLGRPFTYGHEVTLDGVPQVVTHNSSQGTGFSIPANSDCAIIRGTGIGLDGRPSVVHFLWFKNAPATGSEVSVTYNYGEAIFYEKTTIGQLANNANECPYGDGTTSFDPTQPSAIGTGLDFRQTDDRAVKTYRFLENKERTVRIEIKGNYGGATGTPYFIFNFATNRYFHFQNAGIGGWDLWDLDRTLSQDYLRGWQRVAEFNPDRLVIETTPNDDWIVRGHKVFTEKTGVPIAELRTIKNLPLRHIAYASATDDYTISRWRGIITAITETSVTFDGTIDTEIVPGDIIMLGQYWSNNRDYIERKVSAVNGNTLEFLEPINGSVYGSIDGLIGKEIGVRSYASFKTKLEGIIDKLRELLDCPIYILENPMPNVLARELWGYPIVMKEVANAKREVFTINYDSLRKWQSSQPVNSLDINIADASVDDFLGLRAINFGANGENLIWTDVLLDGESIYGTRAVIQNGWAYVVNQTATGTALNKSIASSVNSGQTMYGTPPRLVILDETLTAGVVQVVYSQNKWSGDSCHMNSNSSKLYADFLKEI